MIKELRQAFQDITYLDEKHQYFHKGNTELMSITKFIKSLQADNWEFWRIFKAYQYSGYNVKFIWNNFNAFKELDNDGVEFRRITIYDDHSHLSVTPEEVKRQWKVKSVIGNTRGSYVHDYLEGLEDRKVDVLKTILPDGLTTAQAVNYVNSIKVCKELCNDYVENIKEKLILIVSEFPVGDLKLGLAGTFDRLYFNLETQDYEVWDFKTDKEIDYKSTFSKLSLLDLPDCNFEKYSVQTSFYKKIIQDNTGIKLGQSRVVWFDIKNNKWEIIDCNDYVELLNDITNEENWRTPLSN